MHIMSKFNIDEVVLYQNGNRFELGIVKEVLEGGVPDLPSDAEQTVVCEYRVWYHTGDTTALTPEHCLHKISNAYAFTILRKQADPDLKPRTCREMAVKILEPFMFYGKAYYQLEDWLTGLLERKFVEFPYDIVADEYLRCVVRNAIISRIDFDVYYSDETIEELVDKVIDYIYDKNFIELIDDFIKEEEYEGL